MTKRIALILALFITLSTCLLNGCGFHNHNYQERDGRVVCLDCKEVCTHNYEISGLNAYCSNCLYSCKHSFTENNGDMICDLCGIICTHDYDKDSVCKYCENKCIHEYESTATGTECKFCHADCEHIFENSNGKTICKICGVSCDHKFDYFNGAYKCNLCGTACKHEYKNVSEKSVCKKCGKERILLTSSNANEYFTVNVKIYDVVVKKDYLLGTKDSGDGKADITVTSKKDVKYKNVVVTVLLETTSTAWINQSREVEISFDGYGQKSTNFTSKIEDYVSPNPIYRASIKSVTGEIEM